MNRRRPLIALAAALAALWLAPQALAAPRLQVGAASDAPKEINPIVAKSRMDLAKLAGLNAMRITSFWSRGQTKPSLEESMTLQNAATAARLDGVTLYVSVFWFSRNTPLTAGDRADFAQYVTSLAQMLPSVKNFMVGNEDNLNLFWMPQFDAKGRDVAAPGYEAVLATAYDALKAVSPSITVIGGAVSPRGEDNPRSQRHTHSPTVFIKDLGAAYRKSHRAKPIMDAFAFHPYLQQSKFAPTKKHKSTKIIGLADYKRLVGILGKAFKGTAQPGARLPLVYDEFGVQSKIPGKKNGIYSNQNAPAASDAVGEKTQAKYYRQALSLAYCQPNVKAFLLFLLADEPDLARWQSGIYYADGTPKSSFGSVKNAALAARAGKLARCRGGQVVWAKSGKSSASKRKSAPASRVKRGSDQPHARPKHGADKGKPGSRP